MKKTALGSLLLTLLLSIIMGYSSLASAIDISGAWAGWGRVKIENSGNGTYKGTYTDTYRTGPGTLQLKETGDRSFEGTWGESAKRHGTFSLTATPDGRTLQGTWRADADCTIHPGNGGSVLWTKK